MAAPVRQGSPEREESLGRWPAPGSIRERWTAADLEQLPNDGLRYEIIDGVLLVSPSPLPFHQRASFRLAVLLGAAVPAGAEVLAAPLDWQPDGLTSVQPDLLVVRTADVTRQRLLGTPMLLVEIASPSTERIDRTLKYQTYARVGVPQYWIIDTGGKSHDPSLEVFDLVEAEYRLQVRAVGDEAVTVSGPVPVTVTPGNLVTAE